MTEKEYLYKNKKKHLLITGGFILFNIIAFNIFIKTGGFHADGEYIPYDKWHNLKSSLMSFFIGLPILSLILGTLIALFPFKNLPYNKKYLRASLLTLLSINGLISAMLILIIGMTIVGWYPPKEPDYSLKSELTKEQGIQEFKNEMKILCDSSNYYFDLGLADLENGVNLKKISEKIGPKLKELESLLNNKTQGFGRTASELKLTEKEYEKVFEELSILFQPIMKKKNQLEEKGINLK